MEKVVDDLQCLALVVPIRWQNETCTRDNLSTQQINVDKKKRERQPSFVYFSVLHNLFTVASLAKLCLL